MPSTNQFAQQIIAKTKPIDGTVIITDHQTAGKGQGANTWNAEAGKNITCSMIYDTSFIEARQPYFLNMAVANSLIDLLGDFLPEDELKIKWPNDILFGGLKLAGILLENTVQGSHLKYSVIGIGLNVNQAEFKDLPHASSMSLAAGRTFDIGKVLESLCVKMEKQILRLKSGETRSIHTAYNERLFGKGKEMTWTEGERIFTGVPIEVNSSGQMLASVDGREFVFDYGEVKLDY
jgi:BirA family biotin operon repressor/biotin-[acetyl-CoA-carboxylase] ligase